MNLHRLLLFFCSVVLVDRIYFFNREKSNANKYMLKRKKSIYFSDGLLILHAIIGVIEQKNSNFFKLLLFLKMF